MQCHFSVSQRHVLPCHVIHVCRNQCHMRFVYVWVCIYTNFPNEYQHVFSSAFASSPFGLPMLSGINKSGRILCPEPGEIMVGTSTNFTMSLVPAITIITRSLLLVIACVFMASFCSFASIHISVQAVERGWSAIHCRDLRSLDTYLSWWRHHLIMVILSRGIVRSNRDQWIHGHSSPHGPRHLPKPNDCRTCLLCC